MPYEFDGILPSVETKIISFVISKVGKFRVCILKMRISIVLFVPSFSSFILISRGIIAAFFLLYESLTLFNTDFTNVGKC